MRLCPYSGSKQQTATTTRTESTVESEEAATTEAEAVESEAAESEAATAEAQAEGEIDSQPAIDKARKEQLGRFRMRRSSRRTYPPRYTFVASISGADPHRRPK
jgi:hypothetical protein